MISKGFEILGEFNFLTSYWLLAIDHEEDKVWLMDSSDGLFEYFFFQFISCWSANQIGLNSRSVDDWSDPLENFELFTVSCCAMMLINNSYSFANKAIKETALAAVGQSDKGYSEYSYLVL